MRKARSARPSGARDDPLEGDFDHDAAPMVEADGDESSVQLLELMEDVDEAQREEAFDAMASLVVHTPEHSIGRLMQAGVADRLASGLTDAKAAVRAAAANATRLLCENGGDSVCDDLLARDLFTPLLALFIKMRVTVPLTAPEVRMSFFTILGHVLGAIRELCLRSDRAVDLLAPHAERLLDFLDPANDVPVDLRCSAAHILQSVVEESEPLIANVRASQRAMALLHSNANAAQGAPLLRVLCASIVYALFVPEDESGVAATECFRVLEPVLRLRLPGALLALQVDMSAAAHEAAQQPNDAEAQAAAAATEASSETAPGAQVGDVFVVNFESCSQFGSLRPSRMGKKKSTICHQCRAREARPCWRSKARWTNGRAVRKGNRRR